MMRETPKRSANTRSGGSGERAGRWPRRISRAMWSKTRSAFRSTVLNILGNHISSMVIAITLLYLVTKIEQADEAMDGAPFRLHAAAPARPGRRSGGSDADDGVVHGGAGRRALRVPELR